MRTAIAGSDLPMVQILLASGVEVSLECFKIAQNAENADTLINLVPLSLTLSVLNFQSISYFRNFDDFLFGKFILYDKYEL